MGPFYLCYCKFDHIVAEVLLGYTGLRFQIFCQDCPSFNFGSVTAHAPAVRLLRPAPRAATTGPMSTISDQKKRTLEALQQQYTAAKAKKLQDEQLKSHKNKVDVLKPKFDTPRKGKAPELTPRQKSAQSSSHKGVAFSGSNRQRKPSVSSGEEINPVYDELSCPLRDNLFQDGTSDFDSTEVVQSVIFDIIQKGEDSGKITKGAKKLKLEKGILLDNYVQRGPRLVDAQARSLLIHSKRSKHHMFLKQHKKCGSFDLDGEFHK